MSYHKKEIQSSSLNVADGNKVAKYVQRVLGTGSCSDEIEISGGRIIKAKIADINEQGGNVDIDFNQIAKFSGKDFVSFVSDRIFNRLVGRAFNGLSFDFVQEQGNQAKNIREDVSSVLSNNPSIPSRDTRSSIPPQ